MAIRPTTIGPLLDGVSARTSRGYLHVETFTSTVDPDAFPGHEAGPGAIIHTNGSIKDPRFLYIRSLAISASSTLTLTHSATATNGTPESVHNDLTLSHDVDVVHDIDKSLNDTVALSQSVIMTKVQFFEFEDTLVLDDELHLVYGAALEDTLSFTDDVDYEMVRRLEDSLAFTEDVVCNVVRTFGFSDTLVFGEDPEAQNLTILSVTDILTLSQNVFDASQNILHTVNTLALSQSLKYSPRREVVSHSLTLSHSVRQGLAKAFIEQSLALSQTVIANCNREIAFEDSLSLTQTGVRTVLGTAFNTLSLTQTLVQAKGYYNTLVLTHIMSYALAKHAFSDLVISQTLSPHYVLRRSTTHTLGLTHSVAALLNDPSMCQYSPQSTVIPTTLTLTKQSTVTYVCGVDSLTLRAPKVGDNDTRKYQQIIRETQGGSLRGYRKSNWPKTKTLSYTFEDLCESNADEILEFLAASLGKEVTLTDYYGRDWVGVITTPDAQYTEAGIGLGTITIDFEGEPV